MKKDKCKQKSDELFLEIDLTSCFNVPTKLPFFNEIQATALMLCWLAMGARKN